MTTIFTPRLFHKENNVEFKDRFPDYLAIEEHIRRARVERSLAIAQFLANLIDSSWRGVSRAFAGVGRLRAPQPRRLASR